MAQGRCMDSVRVVGTALTVDTLSRTFFNMNGRMISLIAPMPIDLSLTVLTLRCMTCRQEDWVSRQKWDQSQGTRWK